MGLGADFCQCEKSFHRRPDLRRRWRNRQLNHLKDLIAIIRRNGKVEDVQVLRGVDARLDHNAVEAFRRWQFMPAKKPACRWI